MQLGSYRLCVHQGLGCPGDWYSAQTVNGTRKARVWVQSNGAQETASWQAIARRFRILSQVHHPSVIRVLELHLEHAPPYAVLAEPKGIRLDEHVQREGRLPEQTVLEIGRGLAGALAEAHRLGLTHGRLAPTEIWIDKSHGASIDFAGPVHGLPPDNAKPAGNAESGSYADELHQTDTLAMPAEDIRALGAVLRDIIFGASQAGGAIAAQAHDVKTVTSLLDLVGLMTRDDADERPTADDVLRCIDRLMGDFDHYRFVDATNVGRELNLSTRLAPAGDDDYIYQEQPKQLGRFRLVEKLGEGSLGAVYLGEDSADGQRVAIKILHAHFTQQEGTVRRFKKEARLMAEVKSPHVCRLLDFNHDKGMHYLVMEFVEGESLGSLLAKHKMFPEPIAIAILADVARGLGEAHRRGIVHRDVKPDNILLTGPWKQFLASGADASATLGPMAATEVGAKLCDFGLARHVDQSASLDMTSTGQFVGTPLYTSPEQATGRGDVTPRSDVYSLGVTLFHLLTGRPPFVANNFPALYMMHMKAEAPSPQDLNHELGDAVCQVVLKSLEKDPQARYADADAMLFDLERIVRGEPTSLTIHPRLPALDKEGMLAYDWTFELEASPDQLWPFLANTERLNHAVGIPAVLYTMRLTASQDPGLPSRMERTGTFRKAGFTNTWREHPFEWVEGRRMSVLREYSEGVFKWFASITELQARADGGTTLHHRVRIVPRGFFGRLVAAVEVGFKGQRATEKIYRRIDTYVTRKLAHIPSFDPFLPNAANAVNDDQSFHRILDQLTARGVRSAIAEGLTEFFLKGPAQEITRIRPIALARRLVLDVNEVIDACLTAAHEGILVIFWDILCPICRIPATMEETLRTIQSHGRCPACNLDFELDFANSVEMIFRVNPKLRSGEPGVYCVGGPSHSPHVAAQVRVAASERLELALGLTAGAYRLRSPQISYAVDFRVHAEAVDSRGELALGASVRADFPRSFRAGAQTFLLHNEHSDELLIRVERLAGRDDALTAARASSLARFRELFPQEVLAGKQLVSVAHMTFLATDLSGAAEMYQSVGDAQMFGLLHEYFRIVEDQVCREGGAVVKTINESMLAIFQDPVAALRVALDLQAVVTANSATRELRLCIGVHLGPAMVATINARLDYFGTTVKLAHRLPRLGWNEVVVTQSLGSEPGVQALLRERGLTCEVLNLSDDKTNDMPIFRLVSHSKVVPPPKLRAIRPIDDNRLAQTPVI